MKLSDVEVRIMGSLIEKESTTPDNYPLSLNALANACNQLSNRDPVMSLGEDTVKWAVNNLRQQSLVRAIQPMDSRVMKFQHLAADRWELDTPQLAVLCVLMLRGAQTPGEIKARTNRLADFATLAEVESAVRALVARGLVMELPRQSGRKEPRYTHLLAGEPNDAPATESAADARVPTASEPGDARISALEHTVDAVQRELADLRTRFEEFQRQFG